MRVAAELRYRICPPLAIPATMNTASGTFSRTPVQVCNSMGSTEVNGRIGPARRSMGIPQKRPDLAEKPSMSSEFSLRAICRLVNQQIPQSPVMAAQRYRLAADPLLYAFLRYRLR